MKFGQLFLRQMKRMWIKLFNQLKKLLKIIGLHLHPRERAKYLKLIADQLRANAEHLGKIETIDTGKLYRETKTQANYIAEYYEYFAGLADKVEGTVVPIDKPDMQVTTTRIPIGVVAAIIPWNSQMLLTAVKLAPALAMGNTVVIKASELAPVTLLEFAKLIDKAGLPKGVINIITGLGDPCGKALTTHQSCGKNSIHWWAGNCKTYC